MKRFYDLVYSRDAAAAALLLSLVALLGAGLHNVADGFADVKLGSSPYIHWGGAIAVELGVVAIGLTVAVRARAGKQNFRLYTGILLFVAASVFANYDASLESLTGGAITWERVAALDPWTLTKAGLLGGAIPLMVLMVIESLRELAAESQYETSHPQSARANTLRRKGGRSAGGRRSIEGADGLDEPSSPVNGRVTSEDMRELLIEEPSISATEVARRLRVARATVYRWRDRLGVEREGGRWLVP